MSKTNRIPDYRVLYNQDCTNLFSVTKEPMTAEHVDTMVDEPAQGGADLILINPNSQRVNFPSRVHQTFWDGYTPGDREFFGNVPEEALPRKEHLIAQMKRLVDGGCDYLERALARCRKQSVGAGVSIRMNDHHDTPFGRTHMLSRFYLEHPEYRIKVPFRSSGPYAQVEVLNYSLPEVRGYFLSLIEELVSAYDFDVLELDFLRFPAFFPEGTGREHTADMSKFVAHTAEIISAAGSQVRLFVRGPATPPQAMELGLDVGRWARERWIRGVSVGGQFSTSWRTDLEGYRNVLGSGCALYAHADSAAGWPDGVEPPAAHRKTTSEWVMGTNPELFRGFAATAYARGADGVYAFNYFTAREWRKGDPDFSVLGTLGSADSVSKGPRTFLLANAGSLRRNPNADPPVQLPIEVGTRQARLLHIACADAGDSEAVEVDVVATAHQEPTAADVRLHINEYAVGSAVAVRPLPDADPDASDVVSSLVFSAPPEAIRDGDAVVVVRNDGAPITIVAVRIRVR